MTQGKENNKNYQFNLLPCMAFQMISCFFFTIQTIVRVPHFYFTTSISIKPVRSSLFLSFFLFFFLLFFLSVALTIWFFVSYIYLYTHAHHWQRAMWNRNINVWQLERENCYTKVTVLFCRQVYCLQFGVIIGTYWI